MVSRSSVGLSYARPNSQTVVLATTHMRARSHATLRIPLANSSIPALTTGRRLCARTRAQQQKVVRKQVAVRVPVGVCAKSFLPQRHFARPTAANANRNGMRFRQWPSKHNGTLQISLCEAGRSTTRLDPLRAWSWRCRNICMAVASHMRGITPLASTPHTNPTSLTARTLEWLNLLYIGT